MIKFNFPKCTVRSNKKGSIFRMFFVKGKYLIIYVKRRIVCKNSAIQCYFYLYNLWYSNYQFKYHLWYFDRYFSDLHFHISTHLWYSNYQCKYHLWYFDRYFSEERCGRLCLTFETRTMQIALRSGWFLCI